MIFLFSLILILIPLYFSYSSILTSHETSFKIKTNLEQTLKNTAISQVQILSETKDKIQAKITLKIWENTDEKLLLEKIKNTLKQNFSKKIYLEFEIVRILEV